MRLIGELADQQQAERFTAYLLTEGINTQVEQADGGLREIWVKDEDKFESAVQELAKFQNEPNDQKYSQAVQQASVLSRAQEKKRRQTQKRIVHVGAGGLKPKPRLTIFLIGLCAIVALLTDFGESWRTNSKVFNVLEFVSVNPAKSQEILAANQQNRDSLHVRLASIKRGEIWRLVTPILIHHGTFHILFNMLWLFQLGQMIENRYGVLRLAILVLVTAAISNFFQCTVPDALGGSAPIVMPDGSLLSLLGGMSGVVYGLLGFVWVMSIYDGSSGFYLSQSTLIIMLGWMFFCMIPSATEQLFQVNVANWAHAVGLVVGLMIGYAPVWFQQNFR